MQSRELGKTSPADEIPVRIHQTPNVKFVPPWDCLPLGALPVPTIAHRSSSIPSVLVLVALWLPQSLTRTMCKNPSAELSPKHALLIL